MTPPPPPRPTGRAPVFALAAVTVLLAGAAVWPFVAAGSTTADAERLTEQARRTERAARTAADTANRAVVDAEATDGVTGTLRTAIERTFSYDHADLDATARAADRYLTGEARCQYDRIFAEVRQRAPDLRLVLNTAVRDIALVRLTDEEVEALVFVDQTSTRGDRPNTVPNTVPNTAPDASPNTSSAAAQFGVRARLDGDTWRLTSFAFFDQSLVSGGAVPEC